MNTMTQKQIDFINVLKAEKDLSLDWDGKRVDSPAYHSQNARTVLTALQDLYRSGKASAKFASAAIDFLLKAPALSTPVEEKDDIEAGVYVSEKSGFYIRVYFGQESGRMLAKQVSFNEGTVSYAYLGAASRHVTADYRRCTLEEVGALGQFSGTCAHCGRRLDDPESVDRGIGPVCAEKY